MSICTECGGEFTPNKYRKQQKVCSSPQCQYARQLKSMKSWRGRNPGYFSTRDTPASKEYAKKYRETHKEYLKEYRERHKEQHREYMRTYMRIWRDRKRQSGLQNEKV